MRADLVPGTQLPPVPTQIVSYDGQVVDTSGEKWRLRSAIDGGKMLVFNWQRLDQIAVEGVGVFGGRARQLMKLYIADRLTRRKATTASVYFSSFVRFGRWLATEPGWFAAVCQPQGFEWSRYDERLARTVHGWGMRYTASNGDYFRHLRIFYHWGGARQYPDFSLETARILQSIKAKMHPVGHHVRFRHPTKGPFSPAEKAQIVQAIQAGAGQATDRALVMLLLELGLRPRAIARLRNEDFKQIRTEREIFYQLDVPRTKKRTAQRETQRRPLSARLGQLLARLQLGGPRDHLFHWLGANQPESDLRTAVKRWARAARLVSPRTGQRLHLNSRRFRYTLATHLAEEGASKFHLALVLDHADLNYVDVYTETTSTITGQVAAATDTLLEPLVNRFLGKIVETPDGPGSSSQPAQLIPAAAPHMPLPMLAAGGVGVCGRNVAQEGLCRLFPPLSCYLCPSFAAFRSGVHEELLASIETFLVAQRESADRRIRAQLDEVQQAIRELLSRLEAGT